MSISAQDVGGASGRIDDLLRFELIRAKATAPEFCRAKPLVRIAISSGLAARAAVPFRMRRPVDLCTVASERWPDPEVCSNAA